MCFLRSILYYHRHQQGNHYNGCEVVNEMFCVYRYKFQDSSSVTSSSCKYSKLDDFIILSFLATQFSSGYLGGFPIEFLTQVVSKVLRNFSLFYTQ